MISLEKAKELLKTLVFMNDNIKLEITQRDKMFATKPNSYNVKTSEIGLAVNMRNKEITWVQALKYKLIVETREYEFWIEMEVKL